jgi:hypothetical protein
MAAPTFWETQVDPHQTTISSSAIDPDQVAACWRFINRSTSYFNNAGQETNRAGAQNIIKQLVPVFQSQSTNHFNELKETITSQNKPYYEFDHGFPGYNYLHNFESSASFRTAIKALPRQIVYEADYFALDPMIYKGCLLAWATITLGLNEYVTIKLKKSMKYNGKPIFFPGQKSLFTTPYVQRRAGRYGNKKYRKSYSNYARKVSKFY